MATRIPHHPTVPQPKRVEPAAAPSSYAFVVRLWREGRADPQDEPVWRGTVADLQGHRLGSFSSAAELAGLIGAQPEADVLLHFSVGPAPRLGAEPPGVAA